MIEIHYQIQSYW